MISQEVSSIVTPAEAGGQRFFKKRILAFAGMTRFMDFDR
jgi:hypothetical protein